MDYEKTNKRHRRVFAFLKHTIGPIITRYLGYHYIRTDMGNTPAIILSNHTTDFDPIFLAMSFRDHMYFVASEHIFRWGNYSRIIKFLFAPIARTKGQADVSTVLTTLRLLKKGHSICIFAEGVRTLSGVTEPIAPATAKLVKSSGAQLITFRLEGGYFTTPAWGHGRRRGRMDGRFVNRYMPEELKQMTAAEISEIISRDIFENAYETQAKSPVAFHGKTPAEHLEKVLYLCPDCHRLASLRSEGSSFSCECGLHGVFSEYGMLEGDSLRFHTVTEWFLWQRAYLSELVESACDGFTHTSRDQQLVSVTDETGTVSVAEGLMVMSRESLSVAEATFPLSEINEFSIHGGTVLIFFHKGIHYEIKSPYPRSALLYKDLFNLFKEHQPVLTGQASKGKE